MTSRLGESKANLTGTWHGQYTYPDCRKPVFFVARLLEAVGRIEGTTQEFEPFRGATLYAAIDGRRTGRAVAFIKTYQYPSPGYGAVSYRGTLSGDGTEIEGSWQILRAGSGKFLMIRWNGTEETIAQEVSEFV